MPEIGPPDADEWTWQVCPNAQRADLADKQMSERPGEILRLHDRSPGRNMSLYDVRRRRIFRLQDVILRGWSHTRLIASISRSGSM